MTGHDCAQAGCRNSATHVVIELQPLALLFESGAGLACERHAKMYGDISGGVISIEGFARAAIEENA